MIDLSVSSYPSPPSSGASSATSKDQGLVRSARRTGPAAIGLLLSCVLTVGTALAQAQPKPDWSLSDMPSQKGRVFVITGGTSG